LKLVPNSGQTSVGVGQKIIVSLPAKSLVDLSTYEFNFTGQTQHNGNASSSDKQNYVQTRFFSRNTASLIDNLVIKINGQSRQNINHYGYLFNNLYDYTRGDDANRKNRIGCTAESVLTPLIIILFKIRCKTACRLSDWIICGKW
jgi:hypothetical protein